MTLKQDKKIEYISTKNKIMELRSNGMPRKLELSQFLAVITDIIDSKINEIIEHLKEKTSK